MRKHWIAWAACIPIATLSAAAGAGEEPKVTYSGSYNAWAQSQHDFTFGKVRYNDTYVVQELRLRLNFAASDHLRAITRFDLAQGWWGVDNEDRTSDRIGTTGASGMFDFKDTNFLLHVDQAYVELDVPGVPVEARVGRMGYGVGQRLVLDNNLDGIQVSVNRRVHLGYALVSEGLDSLTDLETTDAAGNVTADGNDAILVTAALTQKVGSVDCEAFGLFYSDAGDDDGTTYVPNDLNYLRSRFTPNLSELVALGLTGSYADTERGLSVDAEADFLSGKDNVEGSTIDARQLTDVNNGDLNGYNLYLRATARVAPALDVGGVFGMGSGDDDWTGGGGNVNKLATAGFFYVTEIWEDSIMPDEEGISPQGLGAPNVRGYRELENTTLLQANAKLTLLRDVSVYASYTYLRATDAIHAWTADSMTTVGDASSSDIGQEIDWRIDVKLYPQLALGFRGGAFLPGEAAGYLINGTNAFDDPAWEHKATLTLTF
jgi:hypothetical protein